MPRQTLCPVALAVALVEGAVRGLPGLVRPVRGIAAGPEALLGPVANVVAEVVALVALALIQALTVALGVLVWQTRFRQALAKRMPVAAVVDRVAVLAALAVPVAAALAVLALVLQRRVARLILAAAGAVLVLSARQPLFPVLVVLAL